MFSRANSRAVERNPSCRSAATTRAMRFQPSSENSYQNLAYAVWSAVRVALPAWPTDFTSAKARAYALLPSVGGGLGRNWPGYVSANGRTKRQPGWKARVNGGVNW